MGLRPCWSTRAATRIKSEIARIAGLTPVWFFCQGLGYTTLVQQPSRSVKPLVVMLKVHTGDFRDVEVF
jgi:hypothetical protein